MINSKTDYMYINSNGAKLFIEQYIETVGKVYKEKFGHKASFYVTEIGDGGREIL